MQSNKNFDSELQAYFGAIKHNIKEEHVGYLKNHPELRQILNDFLSSCLLEQPNNIYDYAKTFFSYFNYQKDTKRHKPLVITGCSGVGKGTIINKLIEKHPDLFELSISYTTRRPRQGEVHGREYYFVTKEEFQKEIERKVFAQYCEVHGNYYGTHKGKLLDIMNRGKVTRQLFRSAYLISISKEEKRFIAMILSANTSLLMRQVFRPLKKGSGKEGHRQKKSLRNVQTMRKSKSKKDNSQNTTVTLQMTIFLNVLILLPHSLSKTTKWPSENDFTVGIHQIVTTILPIFLYLNPQAMRKLEETEKALEKKNKELEERKKRIEEELKKLENNDAAEEEYNNVYVGQEIQEMDEEEEKQEEGEQDIIGQLEAVKKAAEERNQNKVKELRKQFQNNKIKIQKNKEKIEKLEGNLTQAETALKYKNQIKKELEGKGKKISEESKKWINEISKLNDKHEDLKKNFGLLSKQQESLKNSFAAIERKVQETLKQKNSYETEYKNLNTKSEQVKVEIENARQVMKEKQIVSKEENQKVQKNKEKTMVAQKRVERQKNELIKAYKKLNQYIALLRKINAHLQTANTLDFTLKEYLQAIDKTDLIPT